MHYARHCIISHVASCSWRLLLCTSVVTCSLCFCALRLYPYVPATETATQAMICTCTSECLNHTLYTCPNEQNLQYIGYMNGYREGAVLCHCVILTDASQTTMTVTVLSVLLSLVLTLSLSTCAVSAVVHAVMYKRLQRCRPELRGGELCNTPQLSQSLL